MKELYVMMIYDIEDTKIRSQVFEVAKDYGLESIQYSVFLGKLNRNMREELFLKVKDKIKDKNGNVLVIPIGEPEFKQIKSSGKPLSIFQTPFMTFI
jgi:CRISPR-associated protein Cas2